MTSAHAGGRCLTESAYRAPQHAQCGRAIAARGCAYMSGTRCVLRRLSDCRSLEVQPMTKPRMGGLGVSGCDVISARRRASGSSRHRVQRLRSAIQASARITARIAQLMIGTALAAFPPAGANFSKGPTRNFGSTSLIGVRGNSKHRDKQ